MSTQTVDRKQLLTAILGGRNVTTVDIREITLEPGRQTGRHLHPCAVVGYIVAGVATYQIEGEAEQTLPRLRLYEARGQGHRRLSNGSHSAPMTFIAVYLLDGHQDLIQML